MKNTALLRIAVPVALALLTICSAMAVRPTAAGQRPTPLDTALIFLPIARAAPKSQIAFHSTTTATVGTCPTVEICVVNTDGTGLQSLTYVPGQQPTGADWPSWSPDGQKIVYEAGRCLLVMNSDGSNKTQITPNPCVDSSNAAVADYPAWSPDGTKIAATCGGYNSYLCIMNPDGTSTTKVPNTDGGAGGSWSPDSKRLAFVRPAPNYQSWIYLIDVDGSNLTQLTNFQGIQYYPAWSPDGKQIAFSWGYTTIDLYIIDTDGSHLRRLTTSTDWEVHPTWSPDGKQIAFDARTADDPIDYWLYIINVDGTGLRLVTANAVNPAWSPY